MAGRRLARLGAGPGTYPATPVRLTLGSRKLPSGTAGGHVLAVAPLRGLVHLINRNADGDSRRNIAAR